MSNFGSRPRLVIAWKGLQEHVRVAPPSELGGLRGAAYVKLNPQGKMPLLVLPDGRALPESDVIVSYLLDKFAAQGPSLRPATPEARAFAALATRLHDVYLGPLQGCMYKEMAAAQRAAQLAELHRQLGVLETALDADGPFVAGKELCGADAALFPTFVFYTHMLPRRFGWTDVFADKPRLRRWWDAMCADKEAATVRAEMREALGGWDEAGRWDKVCVCADEVVGVRGCCVLTRACRIAARHHRAGGGQQRAQVGVLRAAGRCAWRRG